MLPTDSNKLLLQWKGPFKVNERIRGNNYKIQLVGRTKTFHANMLQKYRKQEQEQTGAMVIESEIPDDLIRPNGTHNSSGYSVMTFFVYYLCSPVYI